MAASAIGQPRTKCGTEQDEYTDEVTIRCSYNKAPIVAQPYQEIDVAGMASLVDTETPGSIGVSVLVAIEEPYFDDLDEVHALADGQQFTFDAEKVEQEVSDNGQLRERIVLIVPIEAFNDIADSGSFKVKAYEAEFNAEMIIGQFRKIRQMVQSTTSQ
jgi:hypothetical protein